MKRPCEDSSSAESDVDEPIDVGSEDTCPGRTKASLISCASPNATTRAMARKKRRGIIEKRRRDRINNSLLELRRLVPTALEKQGSAKLEKAEILQMTVDHLKMLQNTGGKGYFSAHAVALDFLSLGFRECVTEVSRYLGAVEGLDSGDPLASRLVSHLSSCACQRDAAALTAASRCPRLPHQRPPPVPQAFHPHRWAAFQPLPAAPCGPSGLPVSAEAAGAGAPQRLAELSQRIALASYSAHADSSSPSSSSPSSLLPAPLTASLLSLSASFPIALHGGFPILPASSFTPTLTPSPPISSSSHTPPSSSSKPYRPWGTEVGAF